MTQVKAVEEDMIHWGSLYRNTRQAIAALYARKDWEDLDGGDKTWILLEEATHMWFRLRAQPDTPELFPYGKWATLQVLEAMIDNALSTT